MYIYIYVNVCCYMIKRLVICKIKNMDINEWFVVIQKLVEFIIECVLCEMIMKEVDIIF